MPNAEQRDRDGRGDACDEDDDDGVDDGEDNYLFGPESFPVWDEACVNGLYTHLAPLDSLDPGDEVMIFIDSDVNVVVVRPRTSAFADCGATFSGT